MKKILTTVALLGAMGFSASAQIEADIEVVFVSPAGTEASPFVVPCSDSFNYEFLLINKGPGTIRALDTVQFYTPFAPEGYINLTGHEGQAIPANDTIAHYGGKMHRSQMVALWDLTSGDQVYPPFADGNYGFLVLARGFSNADESVIVDPVDDNNESGGVIKIACATSIKDLIGGMNKQALSTYPNPSFDKVNFRFNLSNGNATARILDIAGRAVMVKDFGKQIAGEKELSIDISSLNAGMYYVELVNGENRAISKITVQK